MCVLADVNGPGESAGAKHVRGGMPGRGYRRELKGPGKWTGLDFGNPKLVPALRVMIQTLQRQNREFAPPPGVVVRTVKISLRDGQEMECFVFEPEENETRKETGCFVSGAEETEKETGKGTPAMLYCHGGGFFLPIQLMMMQLAARYTLELKMKVFLPEYRFLPEHPAPVPLWDCQDAWCFLEMHARSLRIDPDRILLYGESAGGTLAAGIALWAREQKKCSARAGSDVKSNHFPAGQMLVYPALDNRCGRYPSARTYSEAAWPLKNNLAMWREYLKAVSADEEFLVPMRTADVGGLPKTYIEPQEMDILHDEAATYARRLTEARVDVTLREISGSYHGFDADVDNPFVQEVVRQRIAWMSETLYSKRIK